MCQLYPCPCVSNKVALYSTVQFVNEQQTLYYKLHNLYPFITLTIWVLFDGHVVPKHEKLETLLCIT